MYLDIASSKLSSFDLSTLISPVGDATCSVHINVFVLVHVHVRVRVRVHVHGHGHVLVNVVISDTITRDRKLQHMIVI